MPGTIVVALGGKAVAPPGERRTIANQFRHTRESLAPMVDLARDGWGIVLVHGNGPQVGDELARNEMAADQVEPLPLGVLVAGTAGWMGYMIQQSLQNALTRAGIERRVVTLITQTLCDANDPNLRNPTKPIGHALDTVGLARLRARGVPVVEERPGRWRRLAPSPRPGAIGEREMGRHLLSAGPIGVASAGRRPGARGRRAGGHRSTGARPRRPEREGGHDARQGRDVNLYEYQAREILRRHGIPVPDGDVATTPDEARAIAQRLGGRVVVKAQVHAGGRGKAGGVKLATNPTEAAAHARQILGMTIKGLPVRKVLVAPAADIASESYVGMIVDRGAQRPVLMVSAAGGVDIEAVAAHTPTQIHQLAVDPRYGLLSHQALGLALTLYRDVAQARAAADIMQRLYTAFYAVGASLAEINPLATTPDGKVMALDAKIGVDENELERRPEIAALRDPEAEAASEVAAREAGLSFIKLDGTVGCCVNGAGLAMATMDLVKYYGGEPANFLDIGGSSNPQKVVAALRIITADPSVRAILFNIFGGITRCDDVANGIVQATQQLPLKVPMVIRLTGTNEQEAVAILTRAGYTALTDMDDAVKQAVARARGKAA